MGYNLIGKLCILLSFLLAIICLSYQSIFLPEGELYEPYILSRNLLIISILNWTFLLGLYLIHREGKNKNVHH